MSERTVTCICPTYRRPALLANAMACFLNQDYSPSLCNLVIVDDAGEYKSKQLCNYKLISLDKRCETISDKYNSLLEYVTGDIIVFWDDDEIYLPWHISAHVKTLEDHEFSKPSKVLSLYHSEIPFEESGHGRFHASIAFTKKALNQVGKWRTNRSDYDLDFLNRMGSTFVTGDPCQHAPPSYIFRWTSTGVYHAQYFMKSPEDETWYERLGRENPPKFDHKIDLYPQFDEETTRVMKLLVNKKG